VVPKRARAVKKADLITMGKPLPCRKRARSASFAWGDRAPFRFHEPAVRRGKVVAGAPPASSRCAGCSRTGVGEDADAHLDRMEAA
jgi:hypothetical protein